MSSLANLPRAVQKLSRPFETNMTCQRSLGLMRDVSTKLCTARCLTIRGNAGCFESRSTRTPASTFVSGGISGARPGSINTRCGAGGPEQLVIVRAAATISAATLIVGRNFFHRLHYAQNVPSIDFTNVGGGVAFLQQRSRQIRKFRNVLETLGRTLDAVEIAADADRVNARDLADVIDVRDDVGDRRVRRFLRREEWAIEIYLNHAALLGQRDDHLIGHIARHIGQRAGVRM